MVITVLKMAAAGELPNGHSRRMGRCNSGGAVFNHQALRRGDTHGLGSMQKYIRRRLSARNHGRCKHPVREPPGQRRNLQRLPDTNETAARRQTARNRKLIQDILNRWRGLEISAELIEQAYAVIGLKSLRNAGAMRFRIPRGHFRKTVPEEILEHKCQVYRYANAGECLDQNLRAQVLAINKHAIAIKNDQ